MNRREFLTVGASYALGLSAGAGALEAGESLRDVRASTRVRELFPRLKHQVYLNAAGATPLGRFAEVGLRRYEELWRHGDGEGRRDRVVDTWSQTRADFARLIGARGSEIGCVHCTKAGEQIVLDGLAPFGGDGNVVTNDLHFGGSLHNLVGLRKRGLDVRIVPSQGWDVSLEAMGKAINDKTALVAVSLVSNVNGRVEPLQELSEIAHAHGAYLYADIIQAAGIVPIDVRSMGIDFAACSGYKWLYGPHGAGFFFVRQELQGSVLADRLFPGHARHNYAPWVEYPDGDHGDFVYHEPTDAQRYEPGHMSYLGYCALYESLRFLEGIGVETALRHSLRLTKRLKERLDPERYPCLSPHYDASPIITFGTSAGAKLRDRLRAENVVVSLARGRLRVSPAVYNEDDDVDLLAEVLNRT